MLYKYKPYAYMHAKLFIHATHQSTCLRRQRDRWTRNADAGNGNTGRSMRAWWTHFADATRPVISLFWHMFHMLMNLWMFNCYNRFHWWKINVFMKIYTKGCSVCINCVALSLFVWADRQRTDIDRRSKWMCSPIRACCNLEQKILWTIMHC